MRILTLCVITLLAPLALAQTSGRHFHRDARLPATPAASPVVEASAGKPATPLAKLRSGRAWPRHHFGRLPQAERTSPQVVDAAHHASPRRRGFWRAR